MKQAILIMVDTQRQDMLSCYDKNSAKTENLDCLAQNGTRFTNGYTCQPVCGPARSAIFTGLYPHSNGMISNSMQLGSNIRNAGQWLSQSGIQCAYIGKWHLDGGDYFGYGRCPDGYLPEYWYDMRNFLDELPDDAARRLSRKNMNLRTDDPPEEDTYAHRCTDRALKFIDACKDRDFFLTLSFDEPHDPSVCPRRFVKQLKEQGFVFKKTPNIKASLKYKPEHQKVWGKVNGRLPFFAVRKGMTGIFACNLFCDYEIGRVLRKVRESGIDPLIIYTADHGDMFMSHKLVGKGCVMYNEITRVPFMISGGGFRAGVSSTPVSHIDLLPTVMAHLGVKIPRMLQGKPLQHVGMNEKRDVFMEFTRYEVDHDGFMGFQPIRCIFDGRYKLVINLLTSDELYDLTDDPYEKDNRIYDPAYAQIRNALHDRLLEQMNVTRDVHRGYYWGRREWRKDFRATFDGDGMTRQLEEEDFVQLDYGTGLPMASSTRKK